MHRSINAFEQINMLSMKVEAVANGFDFLEKDLDITVLGEVGIESIIVFRDILSPL